MVDTEIEPLTPVTVMEYNPGDVVPKVLTVSDGIAGGVAASGLTRQVGRLLVKPEFEVTKQLNETEELKPPVEPRSMLAIAELPGSTADGENEEALIVKD